MVPMRQLVKKNQDNLPTRFYSDCTELLLLESTDEW
uniref:Uncharacterized protein n=1 Tax=Tetranychus urticae TaxID=32264 RepID=T1JW85_TETUR